MIEGFLIGLLLAGVLAAGAAAWLGLTGSLPESRRKREYRARLSEAMLRQPQHLPVILQHQRAVAELEQEDLGEKTTP